MLASPWDDLSSSDDYSSSEKFLQFGDDNRAVATDLDVMRQYDFEKLFSRPMENGDENDDSGELTGQEANEMTKAIE